MADNKAFSESLVQIVEDVSNQKVTLPEFQRDFRWEMDQTYDLFDSLAREIFIGTVIYGKPSFGISVRDFDLRPRKGKGSREKLSVRYLEDDEVKRITQTENFRIVLDGQQRITSIVRALLGKDSVYMVLKEGIRNIAGDKLQLEDILDYFHGEDLPDRVCVSIADAYRFVVANPREKERQTVFLQTRFAAKRTAAWEDDPEEKERNLDIYLDAANLLMNLLRRETLVSYYLLDMGLEKFCAFFERSNSRGIQLDFTDILAAKLYVGFNLREKIDEFETSHGEIRLNRELIVRAIAYLHGDGKSKIDKDYILRNLRPEHFNKYWDKVCSLYVTCLKFLMSNDFVPSQGWLPSENMLLPLMMFVDRIGIFANMTVEQHKAIEYWYWASAFSGRYSGSSNEVIMEDAQVLRRIAANERSHELNAWARKQRPRVSEGSDIFAFQRRGNLVYRALITVIYYDRGGVRDWRSERRTFSDDMLEDHHIYPRAFFNQFANSNPELAEIGESVANRALMPKITNIKVGKRVPADYLKSLNSNVGELVSVLNSHLIDESSLEDEDGGLMQYVLEQRAEDLAELVTKYAGSAPRNHILATFGGITEIREESQVPVFTRYQNVLTEAYFDPARSQIVIGEEILSVAAAARFVVARQNGPKNIQNPWHFWKYRDESGEEKPLGILRDIIDLRDE